VVSSVAAANTNNKVRFKSRSLQRIFFATVAAKNPSEQFTRELPYL